MGKSIEEVLKKELKKPHNQLVKEKGSVNELYEVFDEARFIAKCRGCDKELAYSKMAFSERYSSCRSDEACKSVSKIAGKIKQAEKQEESTREAYGKKLFKILAEYQPVLIHAKGKSDIAWIDVFGTDYARLSNEEKVSLVALVELDGGLYRLKDVEISFD